MKTEAFFKTYNGITVLKMPEFEFERGKIYAVVGSNGSGKSTLAGILAGTILPDSGKRPLKDVSVGFMPQKSFAFRLSARKNILLGGNDSERADMLMSRLSISQLANNKAKSLSGGETARMALARLLMRRYDIIILDEPSAAMDMESTAASEELIRQYCIECGCAVILVTHSLQQAKRIADKILFFSDGELTEYGDKDKLLSRQETDKFRKFLEFYGQ